MSYKVYIGRRTAGRASVLVEDVLGTSALHHVVRHSPDGFEWGYGGSGPSDAALSILTDYLEGSPIDVETCYQAFKFHFLADAPEKGFTITSDQIDLWLYREMRGKI